MLDVLIRDDQVPNLLASLTNSDFPVEIVRVEIVSKFAPSKGPAGMTGGPGMGEMGAGSEMAGAMPGMGEMSGSPEGSYGASAESAFAGAGSYGSEGGGSFAGGGEEFDPGNLSGAGAMGMAPGMSGPGLPGGGAKGKEVIQAAMNDPLLVHVKIGGLMTLYQSAQEANAEATTAETDQAAAPVAAPQTDATAAPGEPTAPADSGHQLRQMPGTEGTPATEGTPSSNGESECSQRLLYLPGEAPAGEAAPLPSEGTPAIPAPDPGAPLSPEPSGTEPNAAGGVPSAEPAAVPAAEPAVQP